MVMPTSGRGVDHDGHCWERLSRISHARQLKESGMNWLLEVSRASLGEEISLTTVLQALLRESTALLSAVFAEKPLS